MKKSRLVSPRGKVIEGLPSISQLLEKAAREMLAAGM
jgi:hypothetical protein